MSSEEEYQEDSSFHSSDDNDDDWLASNKKKKTATKKSTGRLPRAPKAAARLAVESAPIVKRPRKSNEDLTDDEIRQRIIECFTKPLPNGMVRDVWTQKDLRLASKLLFKIYCN